ncbi:hypothetical protein [Weissella minor]|uniref:hypothetical protein n=1 Tax=Weissella minor TaxID=1620 RepID=UPI000710C10F|nr:hypothetical protein [Weissella minor]
MNVDAIRTWLTTEWPPLLSMAHYNRDYMYLPGSAGKNSACAHNIIMTVLNIISTMPTKKSNIFICQFIFNMEWRDIVEMNNLTVRRNQQLLNKALNVIVKSLELYYSFRKS